MTSRYQYFHFGSGWCWWWWMHTGPGWPGPPLLHACWAGFPAHSEPMDVLQLVLQLHILHTDFSATHGPNSY